ncbi:Large neutral amino acids transporter small subunit [Echinococcus granulosus]|uniref:Large neutral amino acids transporter small subunit n=1 Tax=Echinococcus granulosus TaxID=6210 RepID=W6U155_ECHGR|nr:Large neutral amino acids transporter small subunit [Echinococcus granulosus]EUB54845.1 Large neutral amino acids transporter small subunit [Echinococcus granulosus]
MPSILAMIHHCNLTPIPAILILLVLAVGYQFYSDLFALIGLAGFAFSSIAALAVTALLYLRYKEPTLKTSFQVHLSSSFVPLSSLRRFVLQVIIKLPIFFPILFLASDLFILALTIYQQPRESLSNVILMLAAVPIYWLGVSWKNKPKSFQNFIYKGTIFLQKVFACVPVEDESHLDGIAASPTNEERQVDTF